MRTTLAKLAKKQSKSEKNYVISKISQLRFSYFDGLSLFT
jgi:hypothetical protein